MPLKEQLTQIQLNLALTTRLKAGTMHLIQYLVQTIWKFITFLKLEQDLQEEL